jgi:hypothetical protein
MGVQRKVPDIPGMQMHRGQARSWPRCVDGRMKTVIIYDQGTITTVLIPDAEEASLHQLAKDGKILVVKQDNK